VPYYLLKSAGKKIRFVDFKGLTTRDIHGCEWDWVESPYVYFGDLLNCIQGHLDYVYDLDRPPFKRLGTLDEHGCKQILLDETLIGSSVMKTGRSSWQFIAKCE
ncbi:MAG: hypothetical protein VYA34_16665, partial [Myxococcota bacterium]|nr:hypothetical protein [Myxococcota bacterium]